MIWQKFITSVPIPKKIMDILFPTQDEENMTASEETLTEEETTNEEETANEEEVNNRQILDLKLRIPHAECNNENRSYFSIGTFYIFQEYNNRIYRIAEVKIEIEDWLVELFPEPIVRGTIELTATPFPLIYLEVLHSHEKCSSINENIKFSSFFGTFVSHGDRCYNEHEMLSPSSSSDTSSTSKEMFRDATSTVSIVDDNDSDISDVISNSQPDFERPDSNSNKGLKRTGSPSTIDENDEEKNDEQSPKRLRFDSVSESMFPSDESYQTHSEIDERDLDDILFVDETDLSEYSSDLDQRRC